MKFSGSPNRNGFKKFNIINKIIRIINSKISFNVK